MRREIFATARQIAGDVRTSENDFDVAIAGNARLIARLLDARRESGLPARTGRAAVDRALQAMSHAAEARTSLLEMHAELARLDVRELAVGDLVECPEEFKGQLRVVPSQAA
jgi:hypothetical protein